MRNIHVISDTHFGETNILRYKNDTGHLIRGNVFTTIEDMNDRLIASWNKVVKPQDIVYHLGDVYMGQGHMVLPHLNGHKRLVLGNHDDGKSKYLQANFKKIMVERLFKEFDCLLTHRPIIIPAKAKFRYNVHGHIHERPSPTPFHINVSCEAIGYTPMLLEDVMDRWGQA